MDVELIHECVKPLGEHLEAYFPTDESYYDLDDGEHLVVNTNSDVLLKIILEFSYNRIDKGICLSQRAASMWLSTKHEAPMRYVRFHVINEGSLANKELIIACRVIGRKKKKQLDSPEPAERGPLGSPRLDQSSPSASEALPRASSPSASEALGLPEAGFAPNPGALKHVKFDVPVVEEVKKDERGKSPFNRFRKKITPVGPAEGVKKIPLKDCRLPEYAPPGCLLYSTVGNNYKVLPRGLDNEILTMKDGEPTWVMPYPPVKLSEESRKLLAERRATATSLGPHSSVAESIDIIPESWKI